MNAIAAVARLRTLWGGPIGTVARVGIVVAIGAYLVLSIDLRQALDRARSANPVIVTLAIVALSGVHAIAALNWRTILSRLSGARMTRGAALRAYYASQAIGGLTPANLGGDAYRVAASRAAGTDWETTALSVLLQRSTSFVALALLGAAALPFIPDIGARTPVLIAVAVVVAAALAVPIAVLLRRNVGAAVGRRTSAIAGATSLALAGGLAFHGVAIAATYTLVLAVDPSAAGPAAVAAVAVARLSLAVPIVPSGIGIQEGVLVALFTALHLSPETAIAASLLSRLALVATTLIGLGLIARGPAARQPDGSRTGADDLPATVPDLGGVSA